MSRSAVVGVLLTCVALSAGTSPLAQTVSVSGDLPDRTPRELPRGTGLIVGRVLDGDARKPVDRAVVLLQTSLGAVDPVMTDSQGRFVFRNLPKGQYQLRSMRPGYVDGAYAKRSADEELGRDGQPLMLDEDERLTDVIVVTWKYASITGMVTDEAGEPVVDATVRALPRRIVAGRPLFDVGYRAQTTQTDDRGTFRLSSLPPGEYVVVVPTLVGAMPKGAAVPGLAVPSLVDSSNGAGRWFGGGGRAGGPGVEIGNPDFMLTTLTLRNGPGFAGLTKDGKVLVYPIAFYSGASSLARATVIAVRSGDARENVNIQLTPVPTSRVSGTLTGPSGPAPLMLRLTSVDLASATIDAEIAQAISDAAGRFTFFGVPPGDYRIQVMRVPVSRALTSAPSTTVSTAAGGGGLVFVGGGLRLPPNEPTEWADTPVSVSDADVGNVVVTLHAGFRIRGRVQFEGTLAPPAFERIPAVSVERADGRESPNLLVERGGVDPQGNLVTYGQMPGAYFIRVPTAPPGWRFKGAMHGGRDVSVVPLDVSTGDVDGVTLLFTDQPANDLSGTVTTSRGEPAPAASVIVFPADRQQWTNIGRLPRNLRAIGIGSASRYRVTDLPPGSYLVAPTTDRRAAWAEPKFLETLARSAQKITIADGEKRTLDLRLAAAAPMTGPGLRSDPGSGLGSDPGGPWIADSGDESQQVPARDAAQPPLVGTAVIAGIVTTAGDRPQPLRRAVVTLSGGASGGRLVITDDAGRFEFGGLPSGRYTLRAEKPAYLTMWYGATRSDRPGTSIQLGDGQRMADVTLRLVRGATISGVIRDDRGQPAPGIRVQALTYRVVNGERRLSSAGVAVNYDGATDDRGAYRIYGLAPGDYAVVALNRAATSFRLTTEADIDAAMQAARQPAASRAGGAAATMTASRTAAAASPGMSYAPSYFPGTPDISAVTMLSVAAGEEKERVDFAIGFVPTATVEGTVTSAMGPLPANLDVRLVNTGRAPVLSVDFGSIFPHRPGPDGSFRFRGIVPGRYVVAATTGAGGPPLWATAVVAVNGTDVSGITLSLQPGMTVSGRIDYRSTSRPVPSLPGTRVALGPQLTGSQISVGQLQVPAREDGSFSVTGVMPGHYTVRVLPPIGTTGWLVGSAMLKDVDLADHLLEVRPGENVTGIGITLIDQPADLSGVLQDVGGRPAPDYYVILFPADQTMWRQGARRIFQTRPGTDGKFQFRALVGGEYLLAAVTDVETGEWFDPVFLTALARAAVKVTIVTGESKVQDIRIAK